MRYDEMQFNGCLKSRGVAFFKAMVFVSRFAFFSLLLVVYICLDRFAPALATPTLIVMLVGAALFRRVFPLLYRVEQSVSRWEGDDDFESDR